MSPLRVVLKKVRVKNPYKVPHRNFIIEPLQHALISIHETSGLQWWSTFMLTAVSVRTFMLPVVYKQMQAGNNLRKAMPEISYLNTLLKRKNKTSQVNEQASNMSIFMSGARASLRLHDVKLSHMIGAPLVQIPLFASVIMSIRGLVDGGGLGLDVGGLGPFLDLTVTDPSLCLPLAAVTSTYLNIELSLGNYFKPNKPDPQNNTKSSNDLHPSPSQDEGVEAKITSSKDQTISDEGPPGCLVIFKDVVQTGMIVSLPLIATLPTGAFIFWLTSSVLTTVQITVTRNEKFRRHIGLK